MKKTVIGIDHLQVDCLIGVWSHERKIEQRIRVDIEVECDVTAAATTDELAHTLNYASVARDVAFLLKKCQFYLLESAALAIQRWLLTPTLSDKQPSVQAVFVKLTKFSALPGEALASVRGRMTRDDLDHETKEWGTVDIVFETPRMGIYRLNIDAGGLTGSSPRGDAGSGVGSRGWPYRIWSKPARTRAHGRGASGVAQGACAWLSK